MSRSLYLLLSQRERGVEERIYSFMALLSAGIEGRNYEGSLSFCYVIYADTGQCTPSEGKHIQILS